MEFMSADKRIRKRYMDASKDLLSAYEDINAVIVPYLEHCAKSSSDINTQLFIATEIIKTIELNNRVKDICAKKSSTISIREWERTNQAFRKQLGSLQKIYINIVTKEFPENFENGFGV